jgi:hypothetical protein
MQDLNGVDVGIGDRIKITGELTEVSQGVLNFLNCVVQLDEAPPAGGVTTIGLNTRQVELTAPSATTGDLDEFGRPVAVGDAVQLTGVVVGVDVAGPLNSFVQLDALLPPSGTRIRLPLDSTQYAVIETALTQRRLLRLNEQIGQFIQPFRELFE